MMSRQVLPVGHVPKPRVVSLDELPHLTVSLGEMLNNGRRVPKAKIDVIERLKSLGYTAHRVDDVESSEVRFYFDKPVGITSAEARIEIQHHLRISSHRPYQAKASAASDAVHQGAHVTGIWIDETQPSGSVQGISPVQHALHASTVATSQAISPIFWPPTLNASTIAGTNGASWGNVKSDQPVILKEPEPPVPLTGRHILIDAS